MTDPAADTAADTPAAPPTRPSGLALIGAERARQINEEGWTDRHDDEYGGGPLVRAALCYETPAAHRRLIPMRQVRDGQWMACSRGEEQTRVPDGWPWEPEWWKPKSRLRDLVRAGALYQAEVDRLERAGWVGQPQTLTMRANVGRVAKAIDALTEEEMAGG